ncbi:oligopeptide ABC transporter (permease) [Candidatus Hydrogenisulfobacillus filiaventi]|uniref:Oligopeptide ABC transporter (Permease) n=1 Tax=Candidatus Hydrogenisulfobacillus filiaventi TaxID=2707344 RepID=A0A6F8ZGK1_9FIRM|nr:oligopeptide ABC transporter (permease) [Candidatus Hydrogenisulfobacillus filiaventi]
MPGYLLRRLLAAVPVLVGITAISFLLLHLIPGSPARVLLGSHYTPARAAALTRQWGLNRPLWQQYGLWLTHALAGHFGYSYAYHQPVRRLILENLPRTLELVAAALVLSHLLAILLGALQAYYAGSWFDRLLTAAGYFFYAMPQFWLGLLLISVFALRLGWLPAGGVSNPALMHPGAGDRLRHLVLPVTTLVLTTTAGWARYVRTAMQETLSQDYIRTARAKGLSEARVLWVHALRNAVLPLITLGGLSLPGLLAGSLVVEQVFNIPGMGLLFWNAAESRDYPVLLAIVTLLGFLTVLGNLLADLLYAWADPRIRDG